MRKTSKIIGGCFFQEWKDYKLSWNSSEYGGVESIRLPSKLVWTPDILMYNR
jgi:hypothetical protein